MADDELNEGTPEEETGTGGGDRQLAGAALQSALNKERKARAEAERERKQLADRLKEIEDSEKSEVERLTARLEETERRSAEREQQVAAERVERERTDRVRRAATDFADPEEAIAILSRLGQMEDVDSDADAKRVVDALKKDRPHLLRTEPLATGLEQVLRDGKPRDQQEPEGRFQPTSIIPGEQLIAMSDADLAALKRTNPELYFKSVDALGQPEQSYAVAR